MSDYSIKIDGLDKLIKKYGEANPVIHGELTTAMKAAVLDVEAAVKPLVPVGVSGRLRNSIGSEVVKDGDSIVGRIGSSMKAEAYPSVMEFGAKPHFPPPEALERWVHLQLGVPVEAAPEVAFRVARAISRSGIKGREYLKKGMEQAKDKVLQRFNEAVGRIRDRLEKR